MFDISHAFLQLTGAKLLTPKTVRFWGTRYSDLIVFKMAASRHLGFVTQVLGPPTQSICWHFSMSKMWLVRRSSFDNMQVIILCAKLETHIDAPKIRELG